jgi:hypothetical protein
MRKRKFLNDVVNALPRMIMSERMSYADLETLANLPDGALSIDLLNRQAVHSAGHNVSLQIVPHLADWLSARLDLNDARIEDLAHVRLKLVFRTDTIPTIRTRLLHFDWVCACTIAPRDGRGEIGRSPRSGMVRPQPARPGLRERVALIMRLQASDAR